MAGNGEREEISRDWVEERDEALRVRDSVARAAKKRGKGHRVRVEPAPGGGFYIIVTVPKSE